MLEPEPVAVSCLQTPPVLLWANKSCHMTSALSRLSGLSRAFQEMHNLE